MTVGRNIATARGSRDVGCFWVGLLAPFAIGLIVGLQSAGCQL